MYISNPLFFSFLYKKKGSEDQIKASNKCISIVSICLLLITQTGCWDQKIYEKTGFILALGMELDRNGQILYTISVPVVSEDIEEKVDIMSTNVNIIRDGREKNRLISGKRIEGGKTQHIYFSNELASNGVDDLLEVFVRNTENPMLANVVVVEGSPNEMLELCKKYKSKPRPAIYMNDLLEDARKNAQAPEARIYNFIIKKYSKTIDPITPLLHYNDKELKVAGSALFIGDKMVGEIDIDETKLLNILIGKKNNNINYITKSLSNDNNQPGKIGAALLLRNINRKIKTSIINNKPIININLSLTGYLTEYKEGQRLDDSEVKKRLEEEIANGIEQECQSLLKKIQTYGSDPIGFGEIVRSKYNGYWKSVNWRDKYKEATFNIETKLNLEFYGAID